MTSRVKVVKLTFLLSDLGVSGTYPRCFRLFIRCLKKISLPPLDEMAYVILFQEKYGN